MKSAIFSLMLALSAFVGPCGRDQRSVALNQEFTIKAGETISLAGTRLTIDFIEVAEDSRCPENVKCVWAGNGKVVLLASLRGRTPGKVNLNTMLDPKESMYGDFDIKLLKLDPYPKQGSNIRKGDYGATLVVKRK
jgi:hypothetical protein